MRALWRVVMAAICGLFVQIGIAATLDIPTPYVPSTRLNVDEMLRLADVRPGDLVYDLGSGDGRIVIAAARDYGARGVGIEIDPKLVQESRRNAAAAGVADRTQFVAQDVFAADLKPATVVTLYLLSNLVERLQPKLLAELRPGTRIVAHDYGFADWQPERRIVISKTYYLYVVPASIAGKWRVAVDLPQRTREYEVDFQQRYQAVTGGARVGGGFLPAFDARMAGERLSFVFVEDDMSYRFEGRVSGDEIEGTVRYGYGPQQTERPWRARRFARGG